MDPLQPRGLTKEELSVLNDCLANNDLSPQEMLAEAEKHVVKAKEIHETNVMVNFRLAEAIVEVFRKIVADWESIPESAQKWCLGMICYFSLGEDEIDDFESPIGFEDDCEVVNACLKMIDREELCINPEDYDDDSYLY